jgi:phage-related protein
MDKKQPKPLCWLADSLDTVKEFSDEAKRSAGHQLGLVQSGLDPLDWKSMEVVGPGSKEIRIRAETGYRVLYVAKFSEAVYVLHAFVKKTNKTRKQDIDIATKRYKALRKQRSTK